MSFRLILPLAAALSFAVACTGGSTPDAPPPAPPAPPAAPPPPVAPPVAAGSVGVAECDDYIAKMTACLGTMDAAVKAATESGFAKTTDAWRAAAVTPEGKAGLAMGCKAALASIPPTCAGGTAAGTAPVVAPPVETVEVKTEPEKKSSEAPNPSHKQGVSPLKKKKH
ncbi:MAG: hypothetical protein EXR71_09575 [Myxococcales bacterium]|nr:hypothetical protein [Myxococcales bacterium]